MRNILLILLFISSISFAQTGINYQGAATDSQGNKLENQPISLKTSILQGGIEGSTSFSETHNTTTDQFGLFNVVIGLGEVLIGNFDSIQWGVDAHYLKVELDVTGGTDYNLVSTTQMMSVPYAKYAESVSLPFNLDSLAISIEELESNMNVITQFFGCTEPTACNYDVDAVIDDGSCEGLLGCTDAQSSNYDVNATCDDGSCIPYVGMYGHGGVIYKILNNTAYVFNISHEVTQSSMTTTSLSNYANGLNLNGFSDWNVPNSSEFDDICENKALINLVSIQNDGIQLTSQTYWSTQSWCSQSYPSYIPYARPYGITSSNCYEYSSGCPMTGPFKTRVYRTFNF